MPTAHALVREAVEQLAAAQAGVASRQQLLAVGMSSSAVSRRLDTGSWRAVHPGVHLLGRQPLDDAARVWAALLHACSGRLDDGGAPRAVVTGRAALWLHGGVDRCPDVVDLVVPAARRVVRRPGLRLHVRERLVVDGRKMPWRAPVVDAVLEVVSSSSTPTQVVDVVVAATSRRLTTPSRLAAAVAGRRRQRWRGLLVQLCGEVLDGVQSPLERLYLHQVERAHALPVGTRNVREASPTGGSWYRDVRYRGQRLVVELDGRLAHPAGEAFRDRRRDNWSARAGEVSLRYGWREVTATPCEVAAEVVLVLRRQGWRGAARGCRAGCPVHEVQAEGSRPLSGHDASA